MKHQVMIPKGKSNILIMLIVSIFLTFGVFGTFALAFPDTAAAETITFPNGKTVTLHSNGTITGTCHLFVSVSGDANSANLTTVRITMPDGAVLTPTGAPEDCCLSYGDPAPASGDWPFTATPSGKKYSVVVDPGDDYFAGYNPNPQPVGRVTLWEPELIQYGGIRIYKEDTQLGAAPQGDGDLAGAQFQIKDGSKVVTTLTIKKVGNTYQAATADDALEIGKTYTIHESKVPSGYTLASDKTIKLTDSDAGKIKDLKTQAFKENIIRGGRISVVKADATTATSAPQGNADWSAQTAEYTIYNQSSHPVVVDGKTYAANGTVIKTITASWDGSKYIAATSNLPYGTYKIKETKAPNGYVLANWEKTFTIRSANQAVSYTTAAEGWNADSVQRGDIELVKYDDGTDTSTPQGDANLAGIMFDVINMSTNPVVRPVNPSATNVAKKNEVVCTITTKAVTEDGKTIYKASTKDIKPSNWDGALAYGEYKLVERLANEGDTDIGTGYRFGTWENENKQEIWNGWATKTSSSGYKPSSSTTWIDKNNALVQFNTNTTGPKNTVERGDIELVKYDDTFEVSEPQGNASLEGIKFNIINNSQFPVVRPSENPSPTDTAAKGEVVCTIETKAVKDESGNTVYKATTKDIKIPSFWGGALAYGQYEIIEQPKSSEDADKDSSNESYRYGTYTSGSQVIWHGKAFKSGSNADSEQKWISDDKVTVSFNGQTSGPNDTVKRGDLDIQKVDEELARTMGNTSIIDRQGKATLEGAIFDVYNRSNNDVASPITGERVKPGELVCQIKTDEHGIASTELSRAAYNGWGEDCFAKNKHWTYALAYGEYEIIESLPPEGYLLNRTYHGLAVDASVSAPKQMAIFDEKHPQEGAKAYAPNSEKTWIDAEGTLVQFGSVEPFKSAAEGNDAANKDTWVNEQVIRGGVKIGKIDRQNQQYKPQGAASLENHLIAVLSRNPHPVLIHEIPAEVGNTEQAAPQVEVAPWAANNDDLAKLIRAKNTNFNLKKVELPEIGTQTKDGVVVAYLYTKAVEENGEVKYIAETLDDTLPYGTYRLKEVHVPRNSGYLFDQISADWYEDFAIGSDFGDATMKADKTYHTTVTQEDACKSPIDASRSDANEHRYFVDLTNAPKYCVSNYVLRGDIWIQKTIDNASSNSLGYIPFALVSQTTGETHIIVSNENGVATTITTASLDGPTKHSYNTNGNDVPLTKGESGIPFLAKDKDGNFAPITSIAKVDKEGFVVDENGKTPDFQWSNGSWFYGRADSTTHYVRETLQNAENLGSVTDAVIDDTCGALPYDTYTVYELQVPERDVVNIYNKTYHAQSNRDYMMVSKSDFRITVANGEYVLVSPSNGNRTVIGWANPQGADIRGDSYPPRLDLDNKVKPNLKTVLHGEGAAKKVQAGKDMKLTDDVEYFNLTKDATYTLKGSLHKVSFDADNNRVDEGVVATAEKQFKAEGDGTASVDFNFDATGFGGYAVVAFEELYSADGLSISKHEDLNDPDQTADFVEMGTYLGDESGAKEISSYGQITLVDTVAYKGLTPKKEYTVTGTLHIKNDDGTDGGEALDKDGKPITASKKFEAQTRDGSVNVEFKVDASLFLGKQVVAYEAMEDEHGQFMIHADITDIPQTVPFPEIKTTALDGVTNLHIGNADETVTVKDIVEYKNLVKGRDYKITGTIQDKSTKKELKDGEGKVVTNTITFTAGNDEGATETPFGDLTLVSGKVEVPFTIKGADLIGKDVVVFERLFRGPTTPPDTPETPEVEISKTDAATSAELPGATLVVTDKNGSEVERWVSGDTPKKIKLEPGEYTLTEYTTPNGYLTAEDIKFTVNDKGLVDGEKVEMKDAPSEGTEVEISKTDATTSAELPGATLIITDKDGKVLYRYVSTDTPTKVKLPAGEYTLTELTAPFGYTVAENIKFTVNDKGLVEGDKVEMKDAPIEGPEVEISKTDATTTKELPGATLVIKDKDGKVIYQFVSKDEPTKVKLPAGEYTLTELTAPKGYTVAETISFQVDENGLVGSDKVEMKDAPEPETPNTPETPDEDNPIAVHEDINDEGQTVHYPEIGTKATVGDVVGSALATKEITLVDTVSYKNLIPGQKYIMSGTLMDKETGKPVENDGKPVVAESKEFTPKKANGTTTVEFKFDASALGGKDVVAFEKAYIVDSNLKDGKVEVGHHEDLNDAAQTIEFPEIGTQATVNGAKESPATHKFTVEDKVSYKNLVPGQKYVMEARVMDKETGKPLTIDDKEITVTKEFTPKNADGDMTIKVTFDAIKAFGGEEPHDIVMFERALIVDAKTLDEKVTIPNVLVALHEDINDTAQTVKIGRQEGLADEGIKNPGTQPAATVVKPTPSVVEISKSGDGFAWTVAITVVVIAAGAALVLYRRRRDA